MLTQNEMDIIAEKYLFDLEPKTRIPVIILHAYTTKKDYGNIYFFDSKMRVETGDDRYAIAGNAPFLVEKATGKIIVFGTARSEEYYIQEYEAGRWVPAGSK